jgi:hypothetical protein
MMNNMVSNPFLTKQEFLAFQPDNIIFRHMGCIRSRQVRRRAKQKCLPQTLTPLRWDIHSRHA